MTSQQRTVIILFTIIFLMIVLVAFSVPLYNLFCRVTGYGGTTSFSENISTITLDQEIKLQFNADVNDSINWTFTAPENIKFKVGENKLVNYTATNLSEIETIGTATFNVTPDKAGIYFNKVECFCFQEQLLAPNQVIDMPVSFFIDPDMMNDPNLDDVTTITLSYTFFRSHTQSGAITTNEKKAG